MQTIFYNRMLTLMLTLTLMLVLTLMLLKAA
jgi:hypothetical protein